MGQHFVGKKIGLEIFLCTKNLGRKIFGLKKFGLEFLFLLKKNIWVGNLIGLKKMWVGNVIGLNKIWVGNFIGLEKSLVGIFIGLKKFESEIL